MYESVIESTVFAQAINYFTHCYSSVSHHPKYIQQCFTQDTDNDLQLMVVVRPSFALETEISHGSLPIVKVFSATFTLVDVNSDPVCARSVARVQVTH